MACTLIQTTLFVVYLASFWPLSPVSAAKPAATAAQSTMIYPCSVCKCSITVLQRGQSIAADCSNLQLTETPLDLPRRIGTLNMSKNKVNSSQLLHLYKYPNLRHLKASFNAFTTFNVSKEGALSSNFQILTLDLSGNVLKYVNNHTFNKMPYIREIRGLEALTFSSNSLNQLTDLQKLSITSHQVDIPEDLFRNLRISDLKLNATEALYLPEKLFRYSQRPLLSNLLIVGRELRELHVNIMRNLVLLNRVEIVGTNMRLPAHLFHEDTDGPNNNENMPVNLKTIIIDGVRSLPRIIFHKQKSLEHLELHGVEDLPFGLFESVTLDSLDLSGCDIYELQSESFQGLSSLRMLNLSDTKLTSIKVSAFTGLQSLTSLDLSNNFIDNIAPALFDKLRRTLVTLVISNSSLDVLDESAFRNMMSLEKLDLSKNNLTSLPPSLLSDLGKLVDLNLKENQLHNIPPNVLQAQVNMEDLNLGTNLLTGLPPKVFDTTRSLRKVDLSGNNITFLPENIFKGTHFLETVKLSGNPLHCGCEVLLLPQNIIGLELHGYCTSPIEYASTPIQDVQTGDRCIPTTTTTTPTTTTTSTTTTTPTTTTIPITTTTPTTTTTTLARGIMISPITVKDESSTESTQYVDRFGSTRWTVSSYGDIQPSVTLTNANTTTTYNDSYRANVELAQSGGHIFGSFGLDGIYIAMGVVATVFSLGSFAMVMYRRRQAARSMVYVVNPEESTDHSGDGLVGNFARVEPESFDRVVVDDNSPGENPGVRPGP